MSFFCLVIYLLKKPCPVSCRVSSLEFADGMLVVSFDVFLCPYILIIRFRGLI